MKLSNTCLTVWGSGIHYDWYDLVQGMMSLVIFYLQAEDIVVDFV